MALDTSILVDMPEKGCLRRKIGTNTYVYYATRSYRNEKGRPTCDRTSIGRYDEASGKLVPNRNYYEIFKKETPEPASTPSFVENFGAYAVFSTVAKQIGLKEVLQTVFPDRAEMLLTTVHYMIEHGNAMVYLPDWQDETVSFYKKKLTSSKISALFQDLTEDERMYFFREWLKLSNENEYLAYDVTSVSSYSKNIPELEWGDNRDKKELPQVNFAMFYGGDSGIPYYYRIYPGSLNGKTRLEYVVEDSVPDEIKKFIFCGDREMYSEDNAKYLAEKGKPFLLALPEVKYVKDLMLSHQDEVVYGLDNTLSDPTVSGKKYETNQLGFPMNVHIYYDSKRAPTDRAALAQRINKLENSIPDLTEVPGPTTSLAKYFDVKQDKKTKEMTYSRKEDAIEAEMRLCGMFAIADTVFRMSTEEVLDIYRRRDTVEQAFDDLKNAEGLGRTYFHSKDTLDGKAFSAFLGLVIKSYMIGKLRGYMLEQNFTFQKIVIELNKAKVICDAKKPEQARLLNAITKTQREILEHLGLDESIMTDFDWIEKPAGLPQHERL